MRGWRRASARDNRTRIDWAEEVRRLLEEDYPDARKVTLVCDNLNTHGPACLYETFEPERAWRIAQKLEWHYTPKHGSWLNMAEIELSAFARDLPERIGDWHAMASHVSAWEKRRNRTRVKADWQFRTADARIKLRKLYPIADG